MKKLITILLLLLAVQSFSQTSKQSITWLRSQDITNTRYFIWRGDTINFDQLENENYLLKGDSLVLYVTLKQLSDSLGALPGGHDPVVIDIPTQNLGASITGQTLSVKQSNSSQPGLLTSGDWNMFNNKLTAVGHDNSLLGTGTLANPLKVKY